jgi:HD-GYP domain-containing protein (c-di-GMP phosphodiesterase class II)
MALEFSPILARRVMGLVILGLVLISLLIHQRSEAVLEAALLDQVKQQANIFMVGIERQILDLEDPLDPEGLQSVIDRTLASNHLSELGFAVFKMYFFDEQGNILAHSLPGKHKQKEMEEAYLRVFEGEAYLGDELEYAVDPLTKREVPKIDIIVPLEYQGDVAAALEVEVNLEETMVVIKRLDDQYEQAILIIVGGSALLILFFLWWVMQRWMFTPIASIGKVTKEISNGDLSARVQMLGRDELGSLALSVNQMADSIERLFTEQEEAHMQMLQSLAKALEAKDAYTAGHSARVAHFSVKLGKRIGLEEKQITLLRQGALMHDLGKIGISEAILNKPSALDDHEYEIIRKHPVMTATIMRPLKRFREFVEIAAWHHERWDGKGYPDGLRGENIPLLARIVSIADTWDAITGDRVYRKGLSVAQALSILEEERHHGQWDPDLVGTFIEMIRDEQEIRREMAQDVAKQSDG